jgi:hypothetical protein
MSTWKLLCSAALAAVCVAPAARADDFTKLTLLTFSAPVEVPGVTLPAGTYRFELADPNTGRRVIKVSDKNGTKTYGMFLSMANERMTPTSTPVVMFKEAAAGAPRAVQVWFYPGETYGYEFAYPHDQALKIARATHEPVLSYTDRSASSATDADRIAAMKGTEVSRIDENDKPVSTDQALKESSEPRTAASPQPTPAGASQASPAAPSMASARSSTSARAAAAPPVRRHLPRTASDLPLLALLGGLSLAGGVTLRLVRSAA